MMGLEITKLEAALYRLAFIEGSFYQLYIGFPQIKEGETFYSFKSLVRELAVIKLHAFLKIRKSLLQEFVILKKESLDESLRPLWEPIFEQREGLRLLRNKYLAHMQEEDNPFEKTIEGIVYDTKIKSSWNDITFFCGCALNYCRFIKANFQKEFESARDKYHVLIPLEAMLPRFDVKHVKNPETELLDVIDKTLKNLEKNNFITEIPPKENWSVSYTEDVDGSKKSKKSL